MVKFKQGHPQWGRQMQMGEVKYATFDSALTLMVGQHGYVSGSRCRFAYGPADANATH